MSTFSAELRRPEGPPSGAQQASRGKRKPMKDFLMVIMASGIARVRVRATTATATATATESRNMVAILQPIG